MYTYRELSKMLSTPSSALCKYSQGDIVPSLNKSKMILNTLLSRELVKEYIFRFLSKYGWNSNKLLTDPKVINILGMYMARAIIRNLAGSGLRYLLAMPGSSSLIAASISSKLGLPVMLIPSGNEFGIDNYYQLRRGDYIALVSDILTYDSLDKFYEFINRYELTLKIVLAVILVDKSLEKELSKSTLLEYLVP